MNPLLALARMLAALHDGEGRVSVPGFYDDVIALEPLERKQIQDLPFDEADWLKSTGAPSTWGEADIDARGNLARRRFDCRGITGGFQGEERDDHSGSMRRNHCRLVPNQEPDDISRKVMEHLRAPRAQRRSIRGCRLTMGVALIFPPPITPFTKS